MMTKIHVSLERLLVSNLAYWLLIYDNYCVVKMTVLLFSNCFIHTTQHK